MSNVDELRKRLIFLAAFSGMTGLYLAGSILPSFHWTLNVLYLVGAVLIGYFALLEYREVIELYQEQSGSESSSSGREVIEVITQ